MKKFLVGLAVLCLMCVGAAQTRSQTEEFQTMILTGTADVLIDSTLTAALMKDKRLYINNIYLWWDNGANTNDLSAQIVCGTSALREATTRRSFLYRKTMTSSGIETVTFTPNITSRPDSAVYFVISGTGTDTLFMAVNYKIVGE